MKTMTAENLIGKKVLVKIKDKDTYTHDLYNSIQLEKGTVIENPHELSSYKCAYLVKFGKRALNKYKKTHSGQWSHAERMEWWTEKEDFIIID